MGCIALGWQPCTKCPDEHVSDCLPVRITAEQVLIDGRDLSCIARNGSVSRETKSDDALAKDMASRLAFLRLPAHPRAAGDDVDFGHLGAPDGG